MGSDTPRLEVLAAVRKQTEQTSEQHSSEMFLLLMMDYKQSEEISPFIPELLLALVFYGKTRTPN